MRLLTIGHGYTASYLAQLVLASGGSVQGVTRSQEKLVALGQSNVDPRLWSGLSFDDVSNADGILISAAPTAGHDPVLEVFKDYFKEDLPHLKWLGYLSTIAVYGDHQGDWVDEDALVDPVSQRGRWRVQAENEWLSLSHLPVHIFRLGGIYGPGRGPFAKIKAGTAKCIIKPGQYFNRAHVEDMASALWQSIKQPQAGAIYNLVDNEPAPPQDVLSYAAEILRAAPLQQEPFETAQMSDMARSFYLDNKRVRNSKTQKALDWCLKYPTYREGLRAIAQAQQDIDITGSP